MVFFHSIGFFFIDLLQVFATYLQKAIDAERRSLKEQVISAMNAEAKKPLAELYNAGAVDYQAIESAEVTIPVIRADVLTYKPGELGMSTTLGKEGAKVLYSEESLKDPEFLETVMRSPFSVSTHEKNTNEANRDVDGWAREVWFDENDKTVYAKGYIVGADNVQYVKENKLRDGFGTSAFIKFIDVKRQSGTSSTGMPFDAVTTRLSCSHVAILENIRDRKNVIVAINALQEHGDMTSTQPVNDNDKSVSVKNAGEKMADEKKDDIKGAVKDAMNELSEEKARNEKMEGLENQLKAANEELTKMKAAKNAGEEEKKDEPKAENADDKEKEDAENAKNAIASESLVAAASEVLNVRYDKAPTLGALARDFGVTGKNTLELATALNAKITELKKPQTGAEEAKNGEGESEWSKLSKAL